MIEELSDVQRWLSSKIKELWKVRQKECNVILPAHDLVEFHSEEEPHISLTKVGVTLQFHWIQAFTKSLERVFLDAKRFYVGFGEVQVFFNETKTRIFIGKKY